MSLDVYTVIIFILFQINTINRKGYAMFLQISDLEYILYFMWFFSVTEVC